jgi:transposase
MEERGGRTRCPECERLRAHLAEVNTRVAKLEAELAAAQKHSGNSSKPPSSDIVKPPKDGPGRKKKKRRRGGQPGHPRHERPAFLPEQIDKTQDYTLDHCPDCGGSLESADAAPRVIQQVEVREKPIRIEEHRGLAYWCAKCQRLHYAPLPPKITKAGLIGPRLTALVAFLKGACHASFSTIRKFLRDVVGVKISRGQLAKLVQKVSASLRATYEELLAALPGEARLNVDETGHPDQGERLWTWCFRAPLYTLFRIDPSRGSNVLVEVLGKEFDGLLGCDYFSAYRKFMKDFDVRVQFCLAHLIRDVKFLVEHPNPANRRYGKMLLGHLRKLFGVIHRQDTYASEESFRRTLAAIRNDLVTDAIMELANTREAGNLADRFVNHVDSYFRFITTPNVEPTNNLAEQAIRFVAIHRRITQGTHGNAGQRWCERIWTVIGTCAQQGRSVFTLLYEAVRAHFNGAPAPSLLTDSS